MNIYRQSKFRFLRWIIAAIVFILAMTITFTDVYGLNVPRYNHGNGNGYNVSEHPVSFAQEITPPADLSTESPSVVPEPMTLLLMGAGLGALSLVRRRRKA